MEQQISWTIQLAINKEFPNCNLTLPWINLCDKMMKMQPIPKCIVVCWQKPETCTLKLNTDGSYIIQTGKAGIGGILRDENGECIMAFSCPITCSSNNVSEALAAEFGVNWYLHNGYTNFALDIDSLIVIRMLKKETTNNYKMKSIVDVTSQKLKHTNVKFTHCFR